MWPGAKTIRKAWKIPTRTHCNLLHYVNGYNPIDSHLKKRCAKFILSCIHRSNNTIKTISIHAIANVLSTMGDHFRYLSYKYTIGRKVRSGPLCKLLQHFTDYITYNVIDKDNGVVVIRELYIQRESGGNHILSAWNQLCLLNMYVPYSLSLLCM